MNSPLPPSSQMSVRDITEARNELIEQWRTMYLAELPCPNAECRKIGHITNHDRLRFNCTRCLKHFPKMDYVRDNDEGAFLDIVSQLPSPLRRKTATPLMQLDSEDSQSDSSPTTTAAPAPRFPLRAMPPSTKSTGLLLTTSSKRRLDQVTSPSPRPAQPTQLRILTKSPVQPQNEFLLRLIEDMKLEKTTLLEQISSLTKQVEALTAAVTGRTHAAAPTAAPAQPTEAAPADQATTTTTVSATPAPEPTKKTDQAPRKPTAPHRQSYAEAVAKRGLTGEDLDKGIKALKALRSRP
ncbi:hypothetical protein H4R33_007096, partial [Dimargaris cristalligena]